MIKQYSIRQYLQNDLQIQSSIDWYFVAVYTSFAVYSSLLIQTTIIEINDYKQSNDLIEMITTKNFIQNLQDSELIRIFLQFVQTYHLQYEKINKEISYKCYEATWILASTKATGYGRTQSQAYKHALRNLLQLLIQDPQYCQFFIQNININQGLHIQDTKNKAIVKKSQTKTEGYQPFPEGDCKQKLFQSYSKFSQVSNKKSQSNNENNNKKVYHSKISINKSQYDTKQKNDNAKTQQIAKAVQKLKELESYLSSLNSENKVLREKIQRKNQQNIRPEGSNQNNKQNKSKQTKIPKLQLQILPNYHKKSQKSLNDSLLAAYNQKHSVKKFMC